jgi:hypothetical protein
MPSYSKKVQVPGKNAQELYDKVATDIDRFMEKASVGKFEIERDPGKKQVHVKSSMVTGTLFCTDGALQLDAKLSLLAAPFKSKLDEGIDRWISKTFSKNA